MAIVAAFACSHGQTRVGEGVPSAVLSFRLCWPRLFPSPDALNLLTSFPVGPEEFHIVSLWFSYPPTCVLPPPSPLYLLVSCCLLVSSHAFLLGVLLRAVENPGRLHSMAINRPSPCLRDIWPCSCRSGWSNPTPLPPLVLHDTIPTGWTLWGVVIEGTWTSCSHSQGCLAFKIEG